MRSGALITSRLAAEELGREVFALPGRVDSSASAGSLELLKAGGAHLVTAPADVLEILREPARHLHAGTHADRFLPGETPGPVDAAPPDGLFEAKSEPGQDLRTAGLTDRQRALLDALVEPRTVDDLCRSLGAEPAALRADLTILELRRCIAREGSRIARRGRCSKPPSASSRRGPRSKRGPRSLRSKRSPRSGRSEPPGTARDPPPAPASPRSLSRTSPRR